MRRSELDRRRRARRQDWDEWFFGIWLVGCPVLFVLGALGVLPS